MAIEWGDILVVGVYSPPSWSGTRFEEQLEEIGKVIRTHSPGPVIVAGDLNAKSASWGCPRTDRRGGTPRRMECADWSHDCERGNSQHLCAAAGRINCRCYIGLPCGRSEVDYMEGGGGA